MGRALFAFPTKVGTEGIAGVRQDLDETPPFSKRWRGGRNFMWIFTN
jgi:hypothetical protein